MKKKKKTPTILNGINEEEFLKTINIIVHNLAYKFRFGYHNLDDIKQQATIFAIEAMSKYDKNRPLENFLWTHIRNRLFNYKRDNYQRPDKPCLTCPLYDPHKHHSLNQCKKYTDKQNCDPYAAWYHRNTNKKNIMNTTNIDDAPVEASTTEDKKMMIHNKELIKFLDEKIPFTCREYYLKLKYGTKISKKHHRQLLNTIQMLMKEFKYDY